MPIQVRAQIDAEKATIAFREARRDLNKRMRVALKRAGEKEALPAARRTAARYKVGGVPVAGTLVIRSTSRSAYLTTRLRGTLRNAVGLLEYGGTVNTDLQAEPGPHGIPVGGGEFRSTVTGPRHYEPRSFLRDAVQSKRRRIEEVVVDELMNEFADDFEVS